MNLQDEIESYCNHTGTRESRRALTHFAMSVARIAEIGENQAFSQHIAETWEKSKTFAERPSTVQQS